MFDPIWSRRLARSGAQARGHRSGNDGPQTVRVYSFSCVAIFCFHRSSASHQLHFDRCGAFISLIFRQETLLVVVVWVDYLH
jgi:hypothetical protein